MGVRCNHCDFTAESTKECMSVLLNAGFSMAEIPNIIMDSGRVSLALNPIGGTARGFNSKKVTCPNCSRSTSWMPFEEG